MVWLGIEYAGNRLLWKGKVSLQPAREWYGYCLDISVPIRMPKTQPRGLRIGGFAHSGWMFMTWM